MHAGKDGLAIDKILEYAEKEFVVPEPEKQYAGNGDVQRDV